MSGSELAWNRRGPGTGPGVAGLGGGATGGVGLGRALGGGGARPPEAPPRRFQFSRERRVMTRGLAERVEGAGARV